MKLVNLFSPRTVIKLISLWPPYLFSGISIKSVNEDITEIKVQLKQYFFNTNYVGTHFGGSLYSMADPFYMFMLLQHLGKDHIVWDKAAEIDFIKPGKAKVSCLFKVNNNQIEDIKNQALKNFKVEPQFETTVINENNEVVAKIRKTLYVRRKDAKERFPRPELNS